MITKTDFDAKLSCLNRKITSNETRDLLIKTELKKLETEFKILEAFDLIYFRGKAHFEDKRTQN